jgi:hypothetical protein
MFRTFAIVAIVANDGVAIRPDFDFAQRLRRDSRIKGYVNHGAFGTRSSQQGTESLAALELHKSKG